MFKEMARIDMLKDDEKFYNAPANPTKAILFSNPMFGPFDKDLERLGEEFELMEHFEEYAAKMKEYAESSNPFAWLFDFPAKLCHLCSWKWDIGIKLKAAYDSGDKGELDWLKKDDLSEISALLGEVREAHRKQWFRTNKAQGWDSLDEKYGSVMMQTDTGMDRITKYVNGEIDKLEELEEDRLDFYCKPIDDNILGVTHYCLFGTGGLL